MALLLGEMRPQACVVLVTRVLWRYKGGTWLLNPRVGKIITVMVTKTARVTEEAGRYPYHLQRLRGRNSFVAILDNCHGALLMYLQRITITVF